MTYLPGCPHCADQRKLSPSPGPPSRRSGDGVPHWFRQVLEDEAELDRRMVLQLGGRRG